MKQFLMAGFIAALALTLGLYTQNRTERICLQTEQHLRLAQEAAIREEYPEAEAQLQAAAALWRSQEGYLEILLYHDDADEAAVRFAALEAYVRLRDRDDFISLCAELLETLQHLRRIERPVLPNIL